MGTKYIRNTDDATIVCKIPSDKHLAWVFKPYKFDARNNVIVSNGFTEISEEDLELLRKESNTFQYYEKDGKLTLADNLPQEAMSPDQLISMLRADLEAAKAEIAELKEGNGTSAEVDALKAELAETKEGHEQLIITMEHMQDTIDALQEQIADMEIPAVDLDKKDDK